MGKRLSLALWLPLVALLSAQPAAAQGPAPSPSSSPPSERQQHETYQRLKTLGNEALREERFEDALQLFLSAWASWSKDGSLACDVGRLYTIRSEHVHAARWLTRGVNLLADASTPEAVHRRRAEVVDLAVALARVTTLHIETEPGAFLSIDGIPIGTSPQPEPTFVEPGQHRIEGHKGPRYAVVELDGRAGETRRVSLPLPPAEPSSCDKPQPPAALPLSSPVHSPPEPSPVRTARQFVWWPVYLGTALVVVGINSGVILRVAADEALEESTALKELIIREAPGIACANHTDWHPRCLERIRLGERYVTYSDASTAAFIAAGVVAAGTIGFAAFEVDRVSLAPTIGGFVGRYQW